MKVQKEQFSYYIYSLFVVLSVFTYTDSIPLSFNIILRYIIYGCGFVFFLLNYNKYIYQIKKNYTPLFLLSSFSFFLILKSMVHFENIFADIVVSIIYTLTFLMFLSYRAVWPENKFLKPFIFSGIIIIIISFFILLGFYLPLYDSNPDKLSFYLEARNSSLEGGSAFSGPFLNQNAFAAFLLTMLMALTVYIKNLSRLSNIKKIFFYVLYFLSVFFLVKSMSRASIFSYVIFMFFYSFFKAKTFRGLLFILLSTLLFFGVAIIMNDYFEKIINRMEHAGTSGRVEIWHDAFQVFQKNIYFGVGEYTYQNTSMNAHNFFINVLASDGVFAFIFIFMFFVYFFAMSSYVYISSLFRKFRNENTVLFCSIIFAIIFHSMFESHMKTAARPMVIILFLSMTGIIQRRGKENNGFS